MKLLICDDHELYREGLKQLLNNRYPNQDVLIAEAIDMDQAYQASKETQFDLVLLDLSMPNSPGVLGLRKVKEEISAPIAIISADDRIETMQTAFDHGVMGYIPKTYSSTEMLDCIDQLIQGKNSFPEQLELVQKKHKSGLSPKQRMVLKHLIDGCSNREIADNLFLSEGTVKQYVSAILNYLNVDNRTQAAIKGREMLNQENSTD